MYSRLLQCFVGLHWRWWPVVQKRQIQIALQVNTRIGKRKNDVITLGDSGTVLIVWYFDCGPIINPKGSFTDPNLLFYSTLTHHFTYKVQYMLYVVSRSFYFFCFCALLISDNQIYFYGNRKSVNAWFPNKKYNFSKFAFLVLFWIYRCGCIYFHLFVQLCDLNSLIYIDDRERTLPYTVNIVIYDLLLLTSFLFSTGICPIFIVFLRKSWYSVCNETRWVCIPFKPWYIFSALRSFDWKFTVWQRGW